jgi:F0F1-type ATP synthase assembly protein I
MLFLGWLADLILGSSPWGIVVGIVLGTIIGFLQFFRITSQIFKNSSDTPKQNPLSSHNDEKG